jgi:hypothetical protein
MRLQPTTAIPTQHANPQIIEQELQHNSPNYKI